MVEEGDAFQCPTSTLPRPSSAPEARAPPRHRQSQRTPPDGVLAEGAAGADDLAMISPPPRCRLIAATPLPAPGLISPPVRAYFSLDDTVP